MFLPPTLVASIYGMNFDFMPELKWALGYPLAIVDPLGAGAVSLFHVPRPALKRNQLQRKHLCLRPRSGFFAERRLHAFGGTLRAIPPQAIRF
jgi:hypothetical protein